jgi:hypothetical protein
MNRAEVLAKKQYGKWVFYPACDNARIFARIAKTSTLTREVIEQMMCLGFDVKITHEVSSIYEEISV